MSSITNNENIITGDIINSNILQDNTIAHNECISNDLHNSESLSVPLTLIDVNHHSQTMENGLQIIKDLYKKYENDTYMSQKLHIYITQQLVNVLEHMRKTHDQRIIQIEEQEKTQTIFIQSFLNTNHYFYIATTDKYFIYDGIHYNVCKEDDIWYKILLAMSQTNICKHRIKTQIIRKIREKSLLKTIPESETIQLILTKLVPTIFSSKTMAKYFLIILGDNILKKSNDLIHFIDPCAKSFIQELNHFSQAIIGQNICSSIRYRFNGNELNKCRLIQIADAVKSENVWVPIVRDYWLDILCISMHYSIRYDSSDKYVEMNAELSSIAFALKNTSYHEQIETFVSEYIQFTNNETSQISWKNMQFLWKRYLESNKLPNIMYLQSFKTAICERLQLQYNTETELFTGIQSKYMPDIQLFIKYWNETIIMDETEMDFEIEELNTLFKIWSKNQKNGLTEKHIIELITFYFPGIEIERDKYICKIRSSLWDKSLDIQVALDMLKNSGSINADYPIYDAYLFYCKNKEKMVNKMIVSKLYFDKWILDNINEHIIDNKFISKSWFSP